MTNTLSAEDIAKLEELLGKATPAPWRVEPDMRLDEGRLRPSTEYIAGYDILSQAGQIVGCEGITSADSTDADTIVALFNAAPALLSTARSALEADQRINDWTCDANARAKKAEAALHQYEFDIKAKGYELEIADELIGRLKAERDRYRDIAVSLANIITQYPAASHGSLLTTPHAVAIQVQQEMMSAMVSDPDIAALLSVEKERG